MLPFILKNFTADKLAKPLIVFFPFTTQKIGRSIYSANCLVFSRQLRGIWFEQKGSIMNRELNPSWTWPILESVKELKRHTQTINQDDWKGFGTKREGKRPKRLIDLLLFWFLSRRKKNG